MEWVNIDIVRYIVKKVVIYVGFLKLYVGKWGNNERKWCGMVKCWLCLVNFYIEVLKYCYEKYVIVIICILFLLIEVFVFDFE